MANIKPTLREPMSPQSEKFEKNFKKAMITTAPDIAPSIVMNETDAMLSEVEQSLKKKIFSLAKMEALVFSDPKLSSIYDGMAENGEEKYGYHYNETIMNMLFNDYVLNSPKYLQKYKMAIPKEKKRRDKSGINQLKKAGEKKMTQSGLAKLEPAENESVMEEEIDNDITKVFFLVNERDPKDPDLFAYFPEEIHNGEYRTAYSHIGQHSSAHPDYAKESRQASPEEYADLKAELENQVGYNLEVLNGMQESTSAGSAGGAAGYVGYAGPAAFSSKGDLSGDFKGKNKKKSVDPKAKPISTGFALSETNYLTDPSGFEKYVETLNEESDAAFIARNGSNTYGSVDNMNPENQKIIKKDIQTGKWDSNHNIKDGIALQEKAKSKSQQRFMGMVHAVQKGELSPDEVGGGVEKAAASMSDKDAEDFASTKHKGLPDHVDEELGQPDVEYLIRLYDLANAGPNHDPAKTERFKQNIPMMDDQQLRQVHKTLENVVRQMGYKPEQMGSQVVSEGYSIMNPVPLKQIGWLSLPNYKYGGVAIFEISENDSFGSKVGAEYIIGSPYEFEYVIQPDGENNYTIQQNPRFWQRYASLDTDTNKVLYVDDNEKFKYLGKYKDIKLDPNNRWTYDSETEKFWQEIKKLKGEGATFEFNGKPIFDNDNNVKEDMQTMIQNNGTSMSNKAQATGDMSSEVPMGAQQTGGLNEDFNLLEEINKELEAFSIHHDKLKLMAEDKKTPSMVQGDRLRAENPKNFKKDLQHSGTKEIIDVEKELQWKDQQTDVGNDPQKLGMDIEKQEIETADMESDEALKNVGDSTNKDGDQIPKRNLTSDEQAEVDLYRNGQHSLNYDNEPADRFVDRMEADQGEFFEMGEKQKEFKKGAPMYDKDNTFVEDAQVDKMQFDKNVKKKGDKVAWNERMGIGSNVKLGESMITGRYIDALGKRRLMEFRLNEVSEVKALDENFEMKLSFDGLGNTYMSKTVDKKVVVNEGVVDLMEMYKFYTDGKSVVALQNPIQSLTEGEIKDKPVVNEQMDKMKHLLGYKPESYVSTKGVKQNRNF